MALTVPPTWAKELDLALHDVRARGGGHRPVPLEEHRRPRRLLGHLPEARVARRALLLVMTQMLRRSDVADAFELKLQLSQLRYVTSPQAAAASLSETYVGLEVV